MRGFNESSGIVNRARPRLTAAVLSAVAMTAALLVSATAESPADATSSYATGSCQDPCVDVTDRSVLDAQLPGGGRRLVSVTGIAADPGAVDYVRLDVSARAGSQEGTVRIYNPDMPTVDVGVVPFSAGQSATKDGIDVLISKREQVMVENTSTDPVTVTLTVTGWLGWQTAETAALEAAESAPLSVAEEATTPSTGGDSVTAQPEQHTARQRTVCSEKGGRRSCLQPVSTSTYQRAVGSRTAARAFSYCPGYQYWRIWRFQACTQRAFAVVVWVLRNGVPVRQCGTAWFRMQVTMRTRRDTRNMQALVKIRLDRYSGCAKYTWLEYRTRCSKCASNDSWHSMLWPDDRQDTYTLRPSGARVSPGDREAFFMSVMLRPMDGPKSNWLYTDVPRLRCDQLRYIGKLGCVFTKAKPVFLLRKSGKYPASARHIETAQNVLSRHWGARGRGAPISRKYWGNNANLNRREALRKCRAQNVQLSCDEYSFASTHQGCYYYTCHVAGIPLDDNTGSGRALGRHYRIYRILDGDQLWVSIQP